MSTDLRDKIAEPTCTASIPGWIREPIHQVTNAGYTFHEFTVHNFDAKGAEVVYPVTVWDRGTSFLDALESYGRGDYIDFNALIKSRSNDSKDGSRTFHNLSLVLNDNAACRINPRIERVRELTALEVAKKETESAFSLLAKVSAQLAEVQEERKAEKEATASRSPKEDPKPSKVKRPAKVKK
tara:strand:+ start:5621 stop:6169 length:549 start_codon:yes stop_codon:yes gene_type:complete